MDRILTRYWGSHFKSLRHVRKFEIAFGVLADRGWECNLVVEREPEDPAWLEGLTSLGVRLHRLGRPRSSFDAAHVRAIHDLCRRTRCSVFHCDNRHMTPLLGASLAGVPVKVWCKRSMNSHYEQCRDPGWRERLAPTTRLSARLATRIIAVSGAVAGELVQLGVPEGKVCVLNNPRPEMQRRDAAREVTRRELGIGEDELVFAAVGRMEWVKGWDLLVSAFRQVAARGLPCRLLLVGAVDVPGEERIREMVARAVRPSDSADRVIFTGHVSDLPPLLAAADVYVSPSRSEGCSNALLEALEAGLPCIATRVGNAGDVIVDGANGLLVPRNDAGALEDAMARLLEAAELRGAMASRARIPESVPDRRGHAVRVALIYEELLARTGRRGRAAVGTVEGLQTP